MNHYEDHISRLMKNIISTDNMIKKILKYCLINNIKNKLFTNNNSYKISRKCFKELHKFFTTKKQYINIMDIKLLIVLNNNITNQIVKYNDSKLNKYWSQYMICCSNYIEALTNWYNVVNYLSLQIPIISTI